VGNEHWIGLLLALALLLYLLHALLKAEKY
jgi:K+-transporting ATPase KdpF subunit